MIEKKKHQNIELQPIRSTNLIFSKSLKYGLLVRASLELSEGQEGKAIIDLKKCRHGCAWQH
jgi:hypothetical protein